MSLEPPRVPTVLVVDDDEFMRSMLAHVFREASINCETFESAQQLLDHADLSAPAVLLLDVKMPGMSGLALQALLQERGVTLPIVFMTASSDVPMAVHAMRNGAVDFLEKPFDHRMLVHRIRQNLTSAGTPTSAASPKLAYLEYAARLGTLTAREREVCNFMITGKTNKMIARDLGGSFRTIETHRSRVMQKMKATSLAELVRMTFEVSDAPG